MADFKLTSQQLAIVEVAKLGENISVKALAGAAKTSTAIFVAKAVPKTTLYVCYNKSIAVEAQPKFGSHAKCSTMHSLAWQAIVRGTGFSKRGKLQGNLSRNAVKDYIDESKVNEVQEAVELVVDIIDKFCMSYNTDLSSAIDYRLADEEEVQDRDYMKLVIMSIWEAMTDPKSDFPMTHNTYLKLFQLSKPNLGYQLIICDEFQDINPVSLDILLSQECQKVVIGDPWQSIYAFNGAVNAFNHIDGSFTELQLTTSFRFGKNIADLALKVLHKGGYRGELEGKGSGEAKSLSAILARTNLELFLKAADLANKGQYFHVEGGFKELYCMLYSCMALQAGNLDKIYSPRIKGFRDFQELIDACATQKDLGKLVSILRSVDNLPAVINNIKRWEAPKDKASIILSSIHKSKGLEFGEVTIMEGLIPKGEAWDDLDGHEQIAKLKDMQLLNLAYIAITRAESKVNLPLDLIEFFALEGV